MTREKKSQLSETLEKKANSTKQRGISGDGRVIFQVLLSKRFHIEARVTESSMPEQSTGLVQALLLCNCIEMIVNHGFTQEEKKP